MKQQHNLTPIERLGVWAFYLTAYILCGIIAITVNGCN